MAVLATFRVKGDPEGMLASYDRASREIERALASGSGGAERGQPQAHYVCRTDDGMMVVDVWPSEEEARAFVESPLWREALDRQGIPQPEIELFPVHRGIAA